MRLIPGIANADEATTTELSDAVMSMLGEEDDGEASSCTAHCPITAAIQTFLEDVVSVEALVEFGDANSFDTLARFHPCLTKLAAICYEHVNVDPTKFLDYNKVLGLVTSTVRDALPNKWWLFASAMASANTSALEQTSS